jgi:hypothetical protein
VKNLTNELLTQGFNSLKNIFPKKSLEKLENFGERVRIFTPLIVLKGFIYQSLSSNFSCRDALIYLSDILEINISLNTGSYCRARKKLNTETLKEIAIGGGKNISDQLKNTYWIDGSLFRMWDSDENRNEYPHSSQQKEGLGQPLIRVLCCFCALTGAFIDLEFGKYKGKGQAETSLLRKMINRFQSGDILIMDRFFSSVHLLGQLKKRNINFLVRLRDEQAKNLIRKYNVKKGDGIITFGNGKKSDHKEDENIPRKMELRIIKSKRNRKGYRSKTIYLLTDLLHLKKINIEEMYTSRWGVEIALRHLKKTMSLGLIKSKTPAMVEKEIWVSMIAYNIIIKVIDLTKKIKKIQIQVSFKTTISLIIRQIINMDNFDKLIELLASTKFFSPYRWEPRAIKERRKNKYPLLTVRRSKAIKQNWGYQRRRPNIA